MQYNGKHKDIRIYFQLSIWDKYICLNTFLSAVAGYLLMKLSQIFWCIAFGFWINCVNTVTSKIIFFWQIHLHNLSWLSHGRLRAQIFFLIPITAECSYQATAAQNIKEWFYVKQSSYIYCFSIIPRYARYTDTWNICHVLY